MANPLIASVDDARSHFATHSYISTLIEACDKEQTRAEQAKAMRLLADTIGSMFPSSDVSRLLEDAHTLLLENTLEDEFATIDGRP